MTNSPPVLEPTRRGNGKQRQSEEFVSVARDPGPDPDSQSPNQAQQLPSSASDVLEPLSRIAPVPASGRAAAEAAAGIPEGEYDAKEFEGDFGSDSALNLNQSNRSESESERDPADLHFPAKNPRADLSDSRLEQHTTHSHSIPVIANASNPAASLGWYGYPGAGAATVPLSSDPEAGSIQKRNETVQLCHDVDAEGIRSWKRLIVEYS